MAWEHQKTLKKKNIPTAEALYDLTYSIPNERDRALVSTVYLTASRISETLNLRKSDIERTVLKDRDVLIFHLINLKNKVRLKKDIPVVMDRELERKFAKRVLDYTNKLDSTARLFPFTKERAWQIFKRYCGFNPHWVRHIRLTHLITRYNCPTQLLVRFAGWSDVRPAKYYVELRVADFLDYL